MPIAVYAHGHRYDGETRSPPHPDLDLTTGLLIHLPPPTKGEKPRYDVVPLDLERGWRAAQSPPKSTTKSAMETRRPHPR